MPIIEVSQEDVLRGTLVEPGWYKLAIGSFAQQLTKSGDSELFVFECKIINNAETGDERFAGVPITLRFSSKPKAKGFMIGFMRALGEDINAGSRFRIEEASGKTVVAFVENQTYEGRISNSVNHKYRAA